MKKTAAQGAFGTSRACENNCNAAAFQLCNLAPQPLLKKIPCQLFSIAENFAIGQLLANSIHISALLAFFPDICIFSLSVSFNISNLGGTQLIIGAFFLH